MNILTFNQTWFAEEWKAAGHQIIAGQSVPLASFAEGEFRLEITVTDNVAKKSIKRDVVFSVAGS